MEKTNHELVGKVVSDKCDKTITVLVETRPLSKNKHFRLVEIVEKAIIL